MRTLPIYLIVALTTSAAFAQSSPAVAPTHSIKLIKLPNGDYTVPMRELTGSGVSGKVTLHPQGPKTLVSVYVFGSRKHKHRFNLKSGSDCMRSGTGTVALKPAVAGQPSQTIVSVPIENFTSKDYVIDMQNATAERQFEEACAKL